MKRVIVFSLILLFLAGCVTTGNSPNAFDNSQPYFRADQYFQ